MPKYQVNVGCNFGARNTRFEPGQVIDTQDFKGLPAKIAAVYCDQGILTRIDGPEVTDDDGDDA